ncbi:EAL domain-containing protein [Alcaligenaceae bacterium]|nr:EAL domain-containing protein [Alcaligenaceae bacterium]
MSSQLRYCNGAYEGEPAQSARTWGMAAIVVLLTIPVLWLASSDPANAVQLGAGYLPLHSAMEIFSVAVAAMIFVLGWHNIGNRISCITLVFSAAFLAVGLLDLGHLLSLEGMPAFITPNSQSKGVFFWLAARLTGGLALLMAALLPWSLDIKVRLRYVALALAIGLVVLVYWLVLYHPRLLPVMFIDGQGLTSWKIQAEYAIAAIYLVAAWLLLRRLPDRKAAYLVMAAAIMAQSEVCFTFYRQPDDVSNIIGHIYKMIAYVYLYSALVVRNIKEPRQQLHWFQQSRQEQLEHDTLTGLPNRVLALQTLHGAIQDARRNQHSLAVLFLGIDQFKKVNMTFGHSVGDDVIQACVGRLSQVLSEDNVLARQTGDEFIILQRNILDKRQAALLAEGLLHRMRVPFHIQGHEILLSASIGIAVFPDDETNENGLLHKAHLAMSSVKKSTRNSYGFHTFDMEAGFRERLIMESTLHHAVDNGELALHYQPKVNFRTGAVVGVEALVRWEHPVLGLVPPANFIPLAEENGCIGAIGMWVLKEACKEAQQWSKQGLQRPRVSVNLSARQFQQRYLARHVQQVLHDTGLDPARLELEITESTVMQDIDAAVTILDSLKKLGVVLSIDDFGTGYSSLSSLKRFPLNVLKIDRSFIKDVTHDTHDAAITRAIIALARGLGMQVLAEGVETLEQAMFLQANGCDEMQGFYFSRPVLPVEIRDMLHAGALLGRVVNWRD